MRTVDFPIQDNPFSRWKYRKADRIVAVSQCVAEGLKNQGLDGEKITMIYPCIDLDELNKVPALPDLGLAPQSHFSGDVRGIDGPERPPHLC